MTGNFPPSFLRKQESMGAGNRAKVPTIVHERPAHQPSLFLWWHV